MIKNILIGAALLATGAVAMAQYSPPTDDLLNRLFSRTDNPRLGCEVQRRLNRQGEIIWLRLTCQTFGRGR